MTHDEWRRLMRYLDGQDTPKERAATERWLDADPAHRQALDDLRRLHEAAQAPCLPAPSAKSASESWAALRRAMDRPGGDGHRSARPPARADRPLARPRVVRRVLVSTALTAAALLLVAGLWTVLFTGEPASETNAVTWTVGPDESREVVLEDGSRIVLAHTSTLVRFHPGHRGFALEGAAQFDVVPDPERPFTISTAQGSVRALSTTFAVRARTGEETMLVSVQEGEVGLTTFVELHPTLDGTPARLVLGAGEAARAGVTTWPVQVDAALSDILAVPAHASPPPAHLPAAASAHPRPSPLL